MIIGWRSILNIFLKYSLVYDLTIVYYFKQVDQRKPPRFRNVNDAEWKNLDRRNTDHEEKEVIFRRVNWNGWEENKFRKFTKEVHGKKCFITDIKEELTIAINKLKQRKEPAHDKITTKNEHIHERRKQGNIQRFIRQTFLLN